MKIVSATFKLNNGNVQTKLLTISEYDKGMYQEIDNKSGNSMQLMEALSE